MRRFVSLVGALVLTVGTASAATPITVLHEKAEKLVVAWVAAQNQADERAYLALYDAKHFRGVKRARKGTTRYDFAGWSADRLKMMKSKPTVAVEKLRVRTWLEDKKLRRNVIMVRFVQRWKNPRYADHGVKVLLLLPDTKGALKILYEDLLNSESGWEKTVHARTGKATARVASADGAWQKLGALAPSLEKLDDALADLPADEAEERLYARAILEHADAHCDKVLSSSECGDDHVEWEDLAPTTPWTSGCVQRRAVVWALGSETLRAVDLTALAPQLETLTTLPPPEEEIQSAVWSAVDRVGTDALRLGLLRALVENKQSDVAELHTDRLAAKSRLVAVADLHLNSAALDLDEKNQRAAILDALVDLQLTAETREKLFAKAIEWKGNDVMGALVAMAEREPNCELAMSAAEELEERGKPQYIPKRGASDSAESLGRGLCMMQHAAKAERAERYWLSIFPRGRVETIDELDDETAERDEEGNRIDQTKHDKISRKETKLSDLPTEWGAGDAPRCSANSCRVENGTGYLELEFENGKDGKLYLSRIHSYEWRGCGC